MSKSIMQSDKVCYFCGRMTELEKHHIYAGVANRKLSEKYGLWVYLCHTDHTGADGAQYDKEKNLLLKQDAQRAFEKIHGHKMFMEIFRKNYL